MRAPFARALARARALAVSLLAFVWRRRLLPAASPAPQPAPPALEEEDDELSATVLRRGGILAFTPPLGHPAVNGSYDPSRTPPVVAIAAASPAAERIDPLASAVRRAHQIRDILSPHPERRSFIECECGWRGREPSQDLALAAHRDHVADAIQACERLQELKRRAGGPS